MNEKVKHRIVGVIVIAAFLVIIVPAFIKNIGWQNEGAKNPQPFEAPANQALSKMPVATETFQTSQIAHISLDHPVEPAKPLASVTTSAVPSTTSDVPVTTATSPQVTSVAAQPVPVSPKPVQAPKPVVIQPKKTAVVHVVPARKVIITPTKTTQTTQKPVNICIQMGTFANPSNAQLLVARLKAKGFYSAKAEPATFPNGTKGQRVSICRQMTLAEARVLRARVAQLTGNAMIIQQGR